MSLSGWDSDKKIKITPGTGLVPSTQTNMAVLIKLGTSVGTTGFDISALFEELNGKAEVASASPIAWWTMENISGSNLVDEKGSYDLAINNMTQLSGGAYPIGDRNYLLGGDSSPTPRFLDAGEAVPFKSISMFIRRKDTDFIEVAVADSANSSVFFIANSGSSNFITTYDGLTTHPSNLAVSDTNWHHLVWTEGSDNDHHFPWLDGVKGSSELLSNFAGLLRYFGRTTVLTNQGSLDFDNVQLFDYVLSQEDVDNLKNSINGLPKRIALEIGDTGVQCYIEVPPDQWDAANEKATIWAKIASLEQSSFFNLYYDSVHADNDTYVGETGSATAQNVWSDFASAVLPQDPSETMYDSASGAVVTPTGLVAGDFDGEAITWATNEYLSVPDSDALDLTTAGTVILKANVTSSGENLLISKGNNNSTTVYGLSKSGTNTIYGFFDVNGIWGPDILTISPSALSLSTDILISATYDGTIGRQYWDGAEVATDTGSITIGSNTAPLMIGGGNSVFTTGYAGKFYGAFVLPDAKSADWIGIFDDGMDDTLFVFSNIFDPSIIPDSKKLKLTLDSSPISTDQANYPVAIPLGTSVGKNSFDASAIFDELGNNSKRLSIDIGGTQCPVEIENWDSTTEKATLHTKVPNYTNTVDLELTLSFDNSQPDNTDYVGDIGDTIAQTVWDSNFVAVYHMAQDPSVGGACILDSTSNAYHGTPYGSMTSDDLVDGVIGKALDLDGTDDWIEINNGLVSTFPYTLEVVAKQKNTAESHYLLCFAQSGFTNLQGGVSIVQTGGGGSDSVAAVWHYNGTYYEKKGTTVLNTTDFYYLAGTYVGNSEKNIFTNGIDKQILTTVSAFVSPDKFGIGRSVDSTPTDTADATVSEVRISEIERSDDWVKLTNFSLKDQIITWAEVNGVALVQYLDQLYDLSVEILKQLLDQKYDLTDIFKQYLDQKYGETIAVYLAMYYGDAPGIRIFLEQRYQDSPLIKAILDMPYEDMMILRAYLDQPYQLPQGLVAMLEQKYGINEAALAVMLDQKYDISSLNPIISLLNQVYGLQADRNVDYINTSLTINGKIIPIRAVSGECSIDNFCITIDVTLADFTDYLAINIDDSVIFVNGSDTYHMVVDSKQRNRSGIANTSYQISLISPRIDLQSPRNKTFTQEYASGNAETIVEDIIGEEIDWQTVGFPILDDKLYANDETKIDVARKVIRTVGAKLQSNPDGSLRVIPEYPTPVNKWENPDYFMTDTIDFVSQNESFKHNMGFNGFVVRNENTPEDRIWTEQEEITAYKKKVLVFQTPWDSETEFELIHSGGSPVPAPVYQGVVEVTQPAEQVEFVAGFSNTVRPIYGNLQVTWLRENLGNITFSEDGNLEAELKTGTTEGYSLAEVTYTTKYHLWHVSDLLDEDVQYILREVTNE